MAENENKIPEVKKSKHRSPNYPAIGLEKALERANTVKAEAGKNAMPVSVAHDLWGYKKGAGDQQVAALKAFGLVETTGEGDKRQIRLTEAAWRMLGDAPNRPELLKDAALKPDIHRVVWQHFKGDLPKSDAIIKDWLVWEKNFNQSFVDGFIAQFRATIAYAKLSLSDRVAQDQEVKTDSGGKPPMHTAFSAPKGENPPPPKPPVGQRLFPLYLSSEQEAALYVPSLMKQSEYNLLKQQIDNSLAVLQATSVVADPQPYPRSAVWKNKDHDQPVIVIGELGQGPDERRYFKVQGTETGVPENELTFEDVKAKGAA